MFISNNIVFIELQKTGCTHIGKLLSNILEGQSVHKHCPATPELLKQHRIFLGSIRNPWEWYISLWTYGCDRKGGFFERVTRPHYFHRNGSLEGIFKCITAPHSMREFMIKYNLWHILLAYHNAMTRKPGIWKRYYTYSDDIESFRSWLKLVHNPKYRFDFGEGYGYSSIHKFAGLMTYRYLALFCRHNELLFTKYAPTDFDSLQAFEKLNLYISYFIRNENLENDFIATLCACGIHLTKDQRQYIFKTQKTNPSSRKFGPDYYYDEETIQLVAKREKLLIDKFGYKAPAIHK